VEQRFSTRFYYDARADVVQAGSNALVHYLRFGWKEGVAWASPICRR
jgi:hypothetical protein